MNFDFDIVIDFSEETKKEEKKEMSLDQLLNINYDAEELTETISIHEVCMYPLFYSGKKEEMLEWLQPHCVDIAIYKLGKNFKKELEKLYYILGYRSCIYVLDNENIFTSDVERALNRNHFDFKKTAKFLGYDVYEFSKGYEDSYIDNFNPNYNMDIFSILTVNKLEVYTTLYCDVEEMVDLIHYASKNEKNVVMPIEINRMMYISEYLLNKESETTKIKDGNQFELF